MGKGQGRYCDRPALVLETDEQESAQQKIRAQKAMREIQSIQRRNVNHNPRVAETGEQLYIRTVGHHPVLSYPDQNHLIAIYQDDQLPAEVQNKAKELLLLTMQKYVMQVAYQGRWKGRGINPTELIQAGNIGLVEALDQFDLKREFTFLTFAKHKVNMRMQRLTENNSANIHGVRLPVDYYNFIYATVKPAYTALAEEYSRDPSEEEVYEHLIQKAELEEGKIPSFKKVSDSVQWLRNNPVSMQAKIQSSDDNDLEFGASLESEEDIVSLVAQDEMADHLQRGFDQLSPSEQKIFGACHGFGGHPHLKTLRATADHYGIKPASAKRILDDARDKMQTVLKEFGYNEVS